MTSSQNTFNPGEVWLVYLRYEDHPEVGKVRSVVVVSESSDGIEVLALKVTTKTTMAKSGAILVALADWEEEGLLRPSYVWANRVISILPGDVKGDEPLGALSVGDSIRVASVLGLEL